MDCRKRQGLISFYGCCGQQQIFSLDDDVLGLNDAEWELMNIL